MPDVDIDLIKPSPYQPRLFFEVDDLKEEIQRDGLLSALVVRKRDEYYELLDGERRLKTLKDLGWKRVPIDIRDVDDVTARRSVYKLNKIRENYTTEEEGRYFNKLHSEGMNIIDISRELGVEFHWALAHLNVFKFPDHIRKAIWKGDIISLSHVRQLEVEIGRNFNEALAAANEIMERKLSTREFQKIKEERYKEAEEMRLQAAKEALPEITPEAAKLETPEDYKRAADALSREAQRRAEEAMTHEEKAALEAEKQAKAEAQALAKGEREEERRQRRAEEEQHRQERAEAKAREKYKGDKAFVQEALRAMPEEDVADMLNMVPIPDKIKKIKSIGEEFDDIMKMASRVVDSLEKLKREGKIEQLDLKRFSITLRILADCLDEFAKLAEGG